MAGLQEIVIEGKKRIMIIRKRVARPPMETNHLIKLYRTPKL